MSVLWNIQDSQLQAQLGFIRENWLGMEQWTMHLYKNDYTPVPGESLGAYTEADFEDYEAKQIDFSLWGSVSVASHIASTTNSDLKQWDVGATMSGTQTIYGYYMTNVDDDLAWGERFVTPRTVQASDVLKVQAIFRYRNAES